MGFDATAANREKDAASGHTIVSVLCGRSKRDDRNLGLVDAGGMKQIRQKLSVAMTALYAQRETR